MVGNKNMNMQNSFPYLFLSNVLKLNLVVVLGLLSIKNNILEHLPALWLFFFCLNKKVFCHF